MLIQIIIMILLGIIFGIFTGLIPGIHINLISTLLISFSFILIEKFNPISLIVFITSLSITHTFIDFIPGIFLGCPDTDTELSVLPGHDLLKKGLGYEAILLTSYGSLSAVIILIIIAFPLIILINFTYDLIKHLIPYILILISISLILTEKRKINAFIAFLLTGFLGIITLNLESLNQPLLPLLTGLFGGSMLILSIKTKTIINKQKITNPNKKIHKPLIGAIISAPICSFLPGIGSGQAAIIGNAISKTDKKGFLILLGATNTLVMGFSFISLYLIGKTRTGSAIAVKEIANINNNILILILIICLISGIISFFITKNLGKIISIHINKINYTYLSIITLIILIIIIILVSNIIGLIIFILASLTGIYCISLKIKRTNMMGCLLIPTILFYLNLI